MNSDVKINVVTLEDDKEYYENKEKKYDIIEMLYCDGGCNNGNGL